MKCEGDLLKTIIYKRAGPMFSSLQSPGCIVGAC